jgi:YidC/Oxa1 family membrane protein insertase
MNPFSLAYNELLFRPLLNLLVGITNALPGHGVGWAIILVTLLVRLVLLPASLHQAKKMQANQGKMQQLQAQLKNIRKKFKDNKTKQAEETMQLYRQAGINPASGCLPLLIQLPILIALYRVFFIGLTPETYQFLYSFVAQPNTIQSAFLSIDLTQPSLLLGVIAGVAQFVQMRWLAPTPQSMAQPGANEDTAAMMVSMQKNMMYIFPAMTVFIALRLPAALALYWATTTVFGMVQQVLLKRTLHLSSNVPAV